MTTTTKPKGALKAALEPVVRSLLEIERDATSLEAHYAGIPPDVPLGSGPEGLLDIVQARLDLRFAAALGAELDGEEARPGTVRDVLRLVGALSDRMNLGIETSPIDVEKDGAPWTADPDMYLQQPARVSVGVHYPAVFLRPAACDHRGGPRGRRLARRDEKEEAGLGIAAPPPPPWRITAALGFGYGRSGAVLHGEAPPIPSGGQGGRRSRRLLARCWRPLPPAGSPVKDSSVGHGERPLRIRLGGRDPRSIVWCGTGQHLNERPPRRLVHEPGGQRGYGSGHRRGAAFRTWPIRTGRPPISNRRERISGLNREDRHHHQDLPIRDAGSR